MVKDNKKNLIFTFFNNLLNRLTHHYGLIVSRTFIRSGRSLLLFFSIFAIGIYLFGRLPVDFIPLEDTGIINADIQLQSGTAVPVTDLVTKRIEAEVLKHPAIKHTLTLVGENVSSGSGEENASFQFILKPWDERNGHDIPSIMNDLDKVFSIQPEITYRISQPPAIAGMGDSSGFTLELQDRTGSNRKTLEEIAFQIVNKAKALPQLAAVSTTLQTTVPMLQLIVDKEMAKTLNVSLSDLNTMLKQLTGSATVSDFNLYGRTYKVKIQADSNFRRHSADLNKFYVRSQNGDLIPLSILAKIEYGYGPGMITRHNLFSSANISGSAAQGYSSGQAMDAVEKLVNELLPEDFSYEWTGMSYQGKKAGGQAGFAMLLAIVFVYLFLAALYESWSIPMSVLTIIPIALAGSVLTVYCLSPLVKTMHFSARL